MLQVVGALAAAVAAVHTQAVVAAVEVAAVRTTKAADFES